MQFGRNAMRVLALLMTFVPVAACGSDSDGSSPGSRGGNAGASGSGVGGSSAVGQGGSGAGVGRGGSAGAGLGGSGGSAASGGGTSTGGCFAGPQDNFAEATLNTSRWRTIGFSGWTLELVDERLTWTPRPGHNNTRTGLVRSATSFDLGECSTWLEVPRVLPSDVQGEVTVGLSFGTETVAFMRASFGNLLLVTTAGGEAESVSVPYDGAAHRWWRFRETGGVVHLETSPDGRAWSEQAQRVHQADSSEAILGLNVIDSSISGVFEAPQFDNVNTVP